MLLSQWALLGFVAWTMLLVLCGVGTPRITAVLRKQARPNSFNAAVVHGSERYQRTMRAHANCVENLPLFAALVLLGSAVGMSGWQFQAAAFTVLPARVLQTAVHVASGRNAAVLARFGFFTLQLTCFFVMSVLLALRGL